MSQSPTLPDPMMSAPETGREVIAHALRTLPRRPGVYRMNDRDGQPLYIGKARDLRARVSAYTRYEGHTRRIAHMISLTSSMEVVVTSNETEALLLEANYITRLRPRFNIVLRDDKSFPYILIRRDHEAPQIRKYRGSKAVRGTYFGPFASAAAVDRTVRDVQRVFMIRTCTDGVYQGRTRACLLYQIKRCAGPCVGHVSLADYEKLVQQAADFLNGKADHLHAELSTQMDDAARKQDYENAARLRDRIRALSEIRASRSVVAQGINEADVFAVVTEGGCYCVQAFFIRHGQNRGAASYFPRTHPGDAPEDVLAAFLAQFYHTHPCPRLILTSCAPTQRALIETALSLRLTCPVSVRTPKRGKKHHIVQWATRNAQQALAQKLAQADSQARILASVADLFALSGPPARIEVYDNSHIQGSHAIGAMIVAGTDGFEKSSYRLFTIARNDMAPGDDYAMVREVIHRRFARLLKTDLAAPWPDLVLIDGGAGQLAAATETLDQLGITQNQIAIAAIAKGPDRHAGNEQFHTPGRKAFSLQKTDPVLYYLQNLRDEAHRFAISSHRRRRAKDIRRNPLDQVPGIGQMRKKALLHRFGSARAVAQASLDDLKSTDGINSRIAQSIYDHYHR